MIVLTLESVKYSSVPTDAVLPTESAAYSIFVLQLKAYFDEGVDFTGFGCAFALAFGGALAFNIAGVGGGLVFVTFVGAVDFLRGSLLDDFG